ncbi:unnamed protein product [Penicillium pancosmium]
MYRLQNFKTVTRSTSSMTPAKKEDSGVPARQIVMDAALPMVMIWFTLQGDLDLEDDPDSERVTTLLRAFYSEMDLMHPRLVSAEDRSSYSDLTDLSVLVRSWGCV